MTSFGATSSSSCSLAHSPAAPKQSSPFPILLANFVRDVEGVTPSKITRIHYGLDPNEVTGKAKAGALRKELKINESPLIGAIGRLTEQKGFEYLLELLRVCETM